MTTTTDANKHPDDNHRQPSSSLSNFFTKTRAQRFAALEPFLDAPSDAKTLARPDGGLSFDSADKMVENALGTFALPLGVATNFRVNGKDYVIPMVVEEPSVIAAASKAAKLARPQGFAATQTTLAKKRGMVIGQIQVLDATIPDIDSVLSANKPRILDTANACSKTLSKMGKGAKDVTHRTIDTDNGQKMLIVELLVDTADAMGANITNTMCEAVAPLISGMTGGRTLLRILSNYSTNHVFRAQATFSKESLGGNTIVQDILAAYQFAKHDVYRAVTHNKGIMNGITAAATAVGQDTRALEAAAHAYAARDGTYRSLSDWSATSDGNLKGTLDIPLSVGTVGGISNVHPTAAACMRLLGVHSSQELSYVLAAAGLAQNLAAMLALATDGIQKGHMRLHARNLAAAAGASSPDEIDRISSQMIKENDISLARAKQLLL